MPRSLIKPFVVLAIPGMYLFYKYNQYKRQQREQTRRKVTERELDHLNHKIDKLLARLEEHEPELATTQEEECVICISAKATMQTYPCGHKVVCRKCFVKTIQMAVSQRLLPLRCVICRAKILRLKQSGYGGSSSVILGNSSCSSACSSAATTPTSDYGSNVCPLNRLSRQAISLALQSPSDSEDNSIGSSVASKRSNQRSGHCKTDGVKDQPSTTTRGRSSASTPPPPSSTTVTTALVHANPTDVPKNLVKTAKGRSASNSQRRPTKAMSLNLNTNYNRNAGSTKRSPNKSDSDTSPRLTDYDITYTRSVIYARHSRYNKVAIPMSSTSSSLSSSASLLSPTYSTGSASYRYSEKLSSPYSSPEDPDPPPVPRRSRPSSGKSVSFQRIPKYFEYQSEYDYDEDDEDEGEENDDDFIDALSDYKGENDPRDEARKPLLPSPTTKPAKSCLHVPKKETKSEEKQAKESPEETHKLIPHPEDRPSKPGKRFPLPWSSSNKGKTESRPPTQQGPTIVAARYRISARPPHREQLTN